ncbi:hypothetical protein MCFN_01015 [Mycoplasmopsis californica]|uniref:Lipoprotein n=1 Tax=Mycoplasmopsis californica TaxID=2113 RepID=A0A059XVL0_9BACT|nr:hypothetical protein MCFN_01015 [Mycoplasmopsis californica]
MTIKLFFTVFFTVLACFLNSWKNLFFFFFFQKGFLKKIYKKNSQNILFFAKKSKNQDLFWVPTGCKFEDKIRLYLVKKTLSEFANRNLWLDY